MGIRKLYLIVASGKHQGMPIPIKIDLFLIGSDPMCQLRSRLPGIGGQHCAIVTRDNKVFVRDLNSGQPTLVNGELVPPGEEWPLHAKDRLVVGPLEFIVQFREKPLSQRDLEEWALKCLDTADVQKPVETLNEEFEQFSEKASSAAQAAEAILDRLMIKRGVVKGRLRIALDSGITVCRFNDIYLVDEAEIALVRKELTDNLARPNLRVLLDFKNVKRMSTAAVEMIRELYSWLRPWGSTMALCRLRPELQGILHTMGIPVKHFADKKTALTTKW
ncbi:MAG TPA: FHA domain-containing protein [Gemmataceae bacterium]|nr:FHA domain-containing protein [Gemmataceae bacterium]